jgi:hypothetical protein
MHLEKRVNKLERGVQLYRKILLVALIPLLTTPTSAKVILSEKFPFSEKWLSLQPANTARVELIKGNLLFLYSFDGE